MAEGVYEASISKQRGSMSGDILAAYRKPEHKADFNKLVGGSLAFGGLLGAAAKARQGGIPHAMSDAALVPLYVGPMVAAATDDADTRKAALMGTGVAGGIAGASLLRNPTLTPQQKLKWALAVGTTAGLLPAAMIAGKAGQRIHEREELQRVMESNEPVADVIQQINDIREKKHFESRFPWSRYLGRPPVVDIVHDKTRKPASAALSPDDYQRYFEIQRIGTEQRLKKEYKAEHGIDPDDKAVDLIRTRAYDIVSGRLGSQ